MTVAEKRYTSTFTMTTTMSGRLKIDVTDNKGKLIRTMYGWMHEILNAATRKRQAGEGWEVKGKEAVFTIEGNLLMR